MMSTTRFFKLLAPSTVGCVINRSLTLSDTRLHGTNTRRPRLAPTGSATDAKRKALRDSASQLIASTNRKNWEKMNERLITRAGRIPSTNVYFFSDFAPVLLTLSEALCNLREAAHPDMYDCMQNPLRTKFTLNMRTAKKTKFIHKFEGHIVLPHLLDFVPKGRVIALCKDEDEVSLALERGAFLAGTDELFARFEHGSFHREEFDTVVAHERWEPAISKLRSVLKDRLPSKKNGRLGTDVIQMVGTFYDGRSVESTPLDGVPEISFLDVIIGQLSWDDELLRNNLQAFFNLLEAKKSSRAVGSFILSAELYCPPTGESFQLDCSPFRAEARVSRESQREVAELDPVGDQPNEAEQVESVV